MEMAGTGDSSLKENENLGNLRHFGGESYPPTRTIGAFKINIGFPFRVP